MLRYTVRCRFTGPDADLPNRWLAWLREEHLAEVLAAGAVEAEVVCMDDEVPTFEVRYGFESRTEYETYIREAALRLREAGLRRFPLSLGLLYERSCGDVVETRFRPGNSL